MFDKWGGVIKQKKGYLKIYLAMNMKTKEILSLEVMDERVHDGKVMRKFVKQDLDNNDVEK
jgi:hypothetical protein